MNFLKYFLVLCLFLTQLFSSELKTNEEIPAIVSVNWLKTNYNNPNLVIVDLRDKDYSE